jgi:hypothetical protein
MIPPAPTAAVSPNVTAASRFRVQAAGRAIPVEIVFAAGPLTVHARDTAGHLVPIAPSTVTSLWMQLRDFASANVVAKTLQLPRGDVPDIPVALVRTRSDAEFAALCSSADRFVYAVSNETLSYGFAPSGPYATIHADVYSRDCREARYLHVAGLDETTSGPGGSWSDAAMIEAGRNLQAELRSDYLSLLP